ncbi:hypothetical protein JOD24_002569 [Kroppenstedtia sanguinis]|uniref:Small acid-soluble spore protein P (Minor) n=1 Tax=Kroppenstedtia sanguinis TaxID=1380684 RepID=A0ABW4CEZ1_9BACL
MSKNHQLKKNAMKGPGRPDVRSESNPHRLKGLPATSTPSPPRKRAAMSRDGPLRYR